MEKIEITTGSVYWRLTVLEIDVNSKYIKYLCLCECGKTKSINSHSLRKWLTISCWCYRNEMIRKANSTHGMYKTREFKIYWWIKARCQNKSDMLYWGKWITCERKTFEEFYNDMWPRPSKEHSIDRIDWNWNYCKENCRRATNLEQARNARTNRKYKWKCLKEWSELSWIGYHALLYRINSGMDFDKAISTPVWKRYFTHYNTW
jgi:hypothetical protein